MKCTLTTLVFVLATAALCADARADVIKVPFDYVHPQVAVNNAADGDVILLSAGSYLDPIDIGDKSLTLVASVSPGQVTVPRITIHDLSPGKSVVLRALGGDGTAFTEFGPNMEALVIEDNLGHVVVEDGVFIGAQSYAAVRVSDSTSVAFSRCTLTAGGGSYALNSDDADVSLSACTLTGGQGHNAGIDETDGGSGSDAVTFLRGRLYASGCRFIGGDGGHGFCAFDPFLGGWVCGFGGYGGNAVSVSGTASFWEHGNIFDPGSGAPGGDEKDLGMAGLPGQAIHAGSLVDVTSWPLPARDTNVTAVRREGQSGTVVFDGEPGDFVSVWVSLGARWQMLPAHTGAFLVDNGSPFNLLIAVAMAGPSGTLTLPFIAPHMPPGLDELSFHLQGIYRDTSGDVHLGPRTVLTLLDSTL